MRSESVERWVYLSFLSVFLRNLKFNQLFPAVGGLPLGVRWGKLATWSGNGSCLVIEVVTFVIGFQKYLAQSERVNGVELCRSLLVVWMQWRTLRQGILVM